MFTKHDTRNLALSQAKRSARLWKDRLLYDWVELAGERAPTASMLKGLGALGPGRFIGVDRDSAVIAECRELYPHADFAWYDGEMKAALRSPLLSNAGVLVYDSWDGMQNSAEPEGFARSTQARLEPIVAFARARQQQIGEFVLVLNLVNRGQFNTRAQCEYAQFLADRLGFYIDPTRFLCYKSKGCYMTWTAVRLGF